MRPVVVAAAATVLVAAAGGVAAVAATSGATSVSCTRAVSGTSYTVTCPEPVRTVTKTATATVTRTVTVAPAPTTTPPPTTTAPVAPTPTPTPAAPTAGGFPDASTTGVPAGTTLTAVPGTVTSGPGWTWFGGQEDCIHVTTDGTTLTGLNVTGCVEVYANNVTIQDSRVTAPGGGWAVGARGVTGLTVQDSTLNGGGSQMLVGIKDVTGSSTVTALRNNIADWSTGIQLSRGVVQDNYVHDPIAKSGDHINGFTDNGGRTDGTMTVRHNTFLNSLDQADAVSLFEDFGAIRNVTVDDNLLAGGSYSLYAGHNDGGAATSNVVVTGNRFSTRYFPQAGTFGPAACFDHGTGNQWSGNVWVDGPNVGAAVPAPYND